MVEVVFRRKVNFAGDSLTVTVPYEIVKSFGLNKGDSIVWIPRDGGIAVEFEKSEKNE